MPKDELIDDEKSFRLFGLYRKYIESQNNLLNFRATWFIGTQIALFSMYGIIFKSSNITFTYVHSYHAFRNVRYSSEIYPIVAIAIFGCIASIRTFQEIGAAYKAISLIGKAWNDNVAPRLGHSLLPGIISGGSMRAFKIGQMSAHLLPLLSMALWIVIALLHLLGSGVAPSTVD
jgi:hypothetical protein